MTKPSLNPRIFVTGISGQLGQEVFRSWVGKAELFGTCIEKDWKVEGAPVFQLDLTDKSSLRSLIQKIKPEIIINCAAFTAVDAAEEQRELCHELNAEVPSVLAEEAAVLNALLIHISTDYVFDGSGETPRKETESPQPLNQYGVSKRLGERKVETVGGRYVILRTSWVFSPVGGNFVKTMIRLGKTKRELRVVSDQIGAPTSVAELNKAINSVVSVYLSDREAFSQLHSGVYHAACGGETSWADFANKIFRNCKELGIELMVERVEPIATAQYPTPARRPLNSRLCCDRLEEHFGVRLLPWEDALWPVMSELCGMSSALKDSEGG
ncbi:MAG: dTDP-4-dehydrorhamnose reductase [Deltaproteobacteria bacterium]|nr:dTDP-4-dehydrorhamnose reductase [Deltaproteobacteria bacterium]